MSLCTNKIVNIGKYVNRKHLHFAIAKFTPRKIVERFKIYKIEAYLLKGEVVFVMVIRKALLKDLERIQQLNNLLFDLEIANFDKFLIKDWPLSNAGKQYFQQAIKQSFVIVAEIDNKVVGYLLGEECKIPYYNFKIAELCNMCVDSGFRKQRIGISLFKEFERYYNEQGITHFVVTASFKNENAKAFYKKLGFKESNLTLVKF